MITLDTCLLVWLSLSPDRLTKNANKAIENNSLIMSDISLWEIAKISVEFDDSVNLDSADRIIAATSLVEDAPLVTADKNLIKAKIINTIW